MTDIIRLLPEHVANQIAAGEVVQRPASVVKELLDNSIDSGATHINLHIREAGRLLIQVQDNGKGMSATDARMCWERHATSKIERVEDLFRLCTMGFRGEALASIAAVAQVEMRTRRHEDETGTVIRIEGSEVLEQSIAACPAGTTIMVKNLFFNVPARRNFLKSNPVETRHILNEFTRISLSHPHIAFTLRSNETELYNLVPGTQEERILQLFEDRKRQDLIHFEEATSIMHVSGFVGTPSSARKTRDEQFFFVNNRYIRDPYLHHAMMSCYDQLISKEQYPFYVVNIQVDPKEIDVNIHPTKTEIKFLDEKTIYLILKSVIKKALGDFYVTPMYDSSATSSFIPPAPLPPGHVSKAPEIRSSRPVNTDIQGTPTYKRDKTYGWEKLFEVMPGEEQPVVHQQLLPQRELKEQLGSGPFLQIAQRYVVAPVADGMVLIDQRAAHERILFERYLQAGEQQPVASQQKLFPKVIELPKADFEMAEELISELQMMGFDVAVFGNNCLIVHGTPADVNKMDEQELISGMLEDCKRNTASGRAQQKEQLAWSLARRASLQTGAGMQQEEMQELAEALFYCEQPAYTLDGRKTYVKLTTEQLIQFFKTNK